MAPRSILGMFIHQVYKNDALLLVVKSTQKGGEKMSPGIIVLNVLCVVMAACLVVRGAILIPKVHKSEDERLQM